MSQLGRGRELNTWVTMSLYSRKEGKHRFRGESFGMFLEGRGEQRRWRADKRHGGRCGAQKSACGNLPEVVKIKL